MQSFLSRMSFGHFAPFSFFFIDNLKPFGLTKGLKSGIDEEYRLSG